MTDLYRFPKRLMLGYDHRVTMCIKSLCKLNMDDVKELVRGLYGLEKLLFFEQDITDAQGRLIDQYLPRSFWIASLHAEDPQYLVTSVLRTTSGVRGVVRSITRVAPKDHWLQSVDPYSGPPNYLRLSDDTDSVDPLLKTLDVTSDHPLLLAVDGPTYDFELFTATPTIELFTATPTIEMQLGHYFGPLWDDDTSMDRLWIELMRTTHRMLELDPANPESKVLLDTWDGWSWLRRTKYP